jgi:hypothetical protein
MHVSPLKPTRFGLTPAVTGSHGLTPAVAGLTLLVSFGQGDRCPTKITFDKRLSIIIALASSRRVEKRCGVEDASGQLDGAEDGECVSALDRTNCRSKE